MTNMVMTAAERMKRYRARARGEDVPKLRSGPAPGTKREPAAEASSASQVTLAALSGAAMPSVRVEASAASSASVVSMTDAEVERFLAPATAPPKVVVERIEPGKVETVEVVGRVEVEPWATYGELWQRHQVKRGWLDKLVAAGVVPTRSGPAGQEYKLDVVLAELGKANA